MSNSNSPVRRGYMLAPAFFDYPPLATRTRMLESPYNLFFGKMVLRSLFDDYYEEADHFSTKFIIKRTTDDHPSDDFDFTATVHGPLDHKPDEGIVGNAEFRLKRDYRGEIQVCNHISFSVPGRNCSMKSIAYFPKLGFGATCFLPILSESRFLGDYAAMGFRYDRFSNVSDLSVGATFDPRVGEYPSTAWLVSSLGGITAGVHYEPKFGSKGGAPYQNLANWSSAISYGSGSGSPLTPSYNFGLELANNSRFIASFYKHTTIEKQLKNPILSGGKSCVRIRNYIDFGFELQPRVDDGKLSNKIQDFTFQAAASWQFDENLLFKGKLGPLSSSMVIAYKSWLRPCFTCNVSAIRNHTKGETSFGFGIQVDGIRQPSYQRTLTNIIM